MKMQKQTLLDSVGNSMTRMLSRKNTPRVEVSKGESGQSSKMHSLAAKIQIFVTRGPKGIVDQLNNLLGGMSSV